MAKDQGRLHPWAPWGEACRGRARRPGRGPVWAPRGPRPARVGQLGQALTGCLAVCSAVAPLVSRVSLRCRGGDGLRGVRARVTQQ